MKLARRAALGCLAFGCMTAAIQAQEAVAPEIAAPAQVRFQFERNGLEVAKYTLRVNEDGSGRYEADVTLPKQRGYEGAAPTQHADRKFVLTRATTEKIFATARGLDRFNAKCASTAKGIADTGNKTLSYTGEGGDGTCRYNYSEDKRVVMLTDLFEGVAFTLDAGRKLDFEHRFDRLGLDAEMKNLGDAVESGQAAEVSVIAATLRSIVADGELLERVRARAAKLLERYPPGA